MRKEVNPEIRSLIEEYLRTININLVEIIHCYEGGRMFLRILIDKPEGGITIDECSYVNNTLSKMLDEQNFLQESYVLEVSSPGLDRPLVTEKDFLRCLGRKINIVLNEPIESKKQIKAKLKEVKSNVIYVELEDKRILEIALHRIKRAVQDY